MGKPPINVLVVEDAQLVRALLTSFLEADGFQMESASNAAEARSATKDFEPQVAIPDVLRTAAMGHSNHEIAAQRGTAVRAVELLVKRAFSAAGVDADAPGNARVVAARQFITVAGIPHASK